MLQHPECQLPRFLLVRLAHRCAQSSLLKFLQHAIAHFSGRFARKRYRQDLLRSLYPWQQRQNALGQELGFTRPGRSSNTKALRGIQRRCPSLRIGIGVGVRHQRDV